MKILKISLFAFTLSLMSFSFLPTQTINAIQSIKLVPVSWKSDLVDVGSIPQGIPKVIEFQFQNTGDKSIVITNVKPACGCTAADYSKDPIAPGKMGFVKATYNASATGAFTKTVTVTTNADETPKVLTFKGIVLEK